MSDDNVNIRFDFEVNPQSVGRIQKSLENITKEQQRSAKSFEKGNTTLKKATLEQRKLNSEKQELLALDKALHDERRKAIKEEKKLVALVKKETTAQEAAAKAAAKAATEAARFGGLKGKQDRFDTVSKDVSAAGDFQSNLGALRGLSSAAGAGGVSQALDIGGESVALIEELPKLATSAAALPSTIKASASAMLLLKNQAMAGLPALMTSVSTAFVAAKVSVVSFLIGLGPLGIAALVVTVAIAALVAVFLIFKKRSDDAAKAAAKVTEAQKEAEEFTTSAAEARLLEIEQEKERLDSLKAIRIAAGQTTKDLAKEEKALNKEQVALTGVIEDGTTAVNDIKEAEEALAEERTNAALEAGDDAATLTKLRQDLKEANTEELNQIVENLEKKKEVLKAERDALVESGDQSEDTTKEIEKLNDALGDVDEQLQVAGSSASRAAAAEKTLTASREETNKKNAEVDKKAGEAQAKQLEADRKKQTDSLKKASDEARKSAEKIHDIQTKADDDLTKLAEDFNKETTDGLTEDRREELAETRKAGKSRKDLLKSLSRQEEDLIASGDIFAIQDIREETSENLADLRDDFDFDANERRIQRRDEATDRLKEAQEQRRKLRDTALAALAELGVGQKAIQTGWRNMLTGLGNDLKSFTGAITGRAGNVAGRVPSVGGLPSLPQIAMSVSIDGAPVRAIAQQEIRAVN